MSHRTLTRVEYTVIFDYTTTDWITHPYIHVTMKTDTVNTWVTSLIPIQGWARESEVARRCIVERFSVEWDQLSVDDCVVASNTTTVKLHANF